MNDRFHFYIHQPGFTKQAVSSAADKKIDPISGRVSLENLEKTFPGWKGRIAQVRKVICLVAGDYATRPSQPDHLSDDYVDAGHIHEYEPRMNQVKASCRQLCRASLALKHVNIFQATIGHKASRNRNGVAVSFDTDRCDPTSIARRRAAASPDFIPQKALCFSSEHTFVFCPIKRKSGVVRIISGAKKSRVVPGRYFADCAKSRMYEYGGSLVRSRLAR
jgi:hypothetical protein